MQLAKSIKVLYKDKLAFWLLNFSVLFILATWSLFLFKPIEASPISVLHYNIYAGIDILGDSKWLYLTPAIFLLISVIDFALAVFLWTKSRLSTYLLLATILIVNIVLFLYIYNILNYN